MKAGLTGSIATGKSTVAGFFKEMSARVVDADEIAHQTLKRADVQEEIVKKYGKDILDGHQHVDRKKLGGIIFKDTSARQWLNGLVHPIVYQEIDKKIRRIQKDARQNLIIVDVPLLIESGEPRRFGPVVLAYCPEEIQLERLQQRDNLDRRNAIQRIRTQMSVEEKRKYADYIIDTTGTVQHTQQQVREVYRKLLSNKYFTN